MPYIFVHYNPGQFIDLCEKRTECFGHNSVKSCLAGALESRVNVASAKFACFCWDLQNGKFFFAVGPVCFLSFSVEKVTNTCLSLLALYMFLDMDTSWLPITIFYKCCFYDLDLPLTVVCICIVMNESRCVNTDWGFICPYMNDKPFLKEKLISCWSFKANKDLSNVSVCFLFLLADLKLGNKNKLILI